jgi:hypothetical protein
VNIADSETPSPPLPPVTAEPGGFGESAPVGIEPVRFDE